AQQQACSCNWQWNWTWDWSNNAPPAATGDAPADGGAPADSQAAPFTTDNGPITQWNSVDASATATSVVDVTPLSSVAQSGADPGLVQQQVESGQSFVNDQAAAAAARADQLNPWNLNSVWGYGIPVASVTQSNVLSADSTAVTLASVDQELIQGQDVLFNAQDVANANADGTDASQAATAGNEG